MENNEIKYYLDENFLLNIRVGDEELKITDEFIDNLINYSSKVKENIKDVNRGFRYCSFSFNEQSVEILKEPIFCYLSKEKKNIKIYSELHLNLLLEKINYYKPYFIKKETNEEILFNEKKINLLTVPELTIFETDQSNRIIETIFENMNNLYSKDFKDGESTYNYISFNFNKYFRVNVNLDNKFYFLSSKERNIIICKLESFLIEPNQENILAICGPYGIGKSVLSLFLQKYMFVQKKIKSLYINLKFYFDKQKESNFKEIIDTLITECFFLVSNKNELLELYNIIKKENVDIWLLVHKIKKFLKEKKKGDYIFIIDQYKYLFDKDHNLYFISLDTKVFLLSSINDGDVKSNLIYYLDKKIEKKETFLNLEIENEMRINYFYIQKLIKFNENMFQIVSNEIKNINSFDMNLIKEKFDNLPKYVYLYLFHYQNIVDLFNDSSKKIFLNLNKFYKGDFNGNILKKIEEKEYIQKNDLTYDLQKIPLKYINYYENITNGTFYYEYAFPLIKDIFFEYNNFILDKNAFFTEKNQSKLGNIFKSIVKTVLRNYDIFEINGYLEVNEIINMELNGIYAKIDKNYFLNKKAILINQNKNNGELLDFAIYQVKEENLILFQAKYNITSNNIKHRDNYIKPSKKINNLFKEKFDIELKNIYLLYITSYEYNIQNSNLISILNKNQLNCLFYSVQNNIFSFDFAFDKLFFPINHLKCENEFRLIPESKYSNLLENYQDKILKKSFKLPKKFKYNYNVFDKNINLNMKFDLKEEYKTFIHHINKDFIIDNKLRERLGPFGDFFYYCFGEHHDNTLNDIKYYLVFSLKEKDKDSCQINYDEKIGLMYYNGDEECYLNLKNLNEEFNENYRFKYIFYQKSFIKGMFYPEKKVIFQHLQL